MFKLAQIMPRLSNFNSCQKSDLVGIFFNSRLSLFVPVWRTTSSILLVYRILWNLIWKICMASGSIWLSKKVVNLALKYTHEIRPEWYENLNYLKLHYFPRHIGDSRKINRSYCSFTSLDSFFKKKITDFDLIFDEPEFLYFLLVL